MSLLLVPQKSGNSCSAHQRAAYRGAAYSAQAASWQGMVHHITADSMDGDIPPEPEGLSPTAPPQSPMNYAPGCYKKPIDAVLAQTKRHLHDVVNDFERKRTAYFVEAFHSHRVYWQAYRTFSKSLFEVNDHVKGVRRGSARSASMQNMIATAAATDDSTSTVNSSSNHSKAATVHTSLSEKSASAFSLGKNRRNSNSVNPMVPASMKQSSQSDKVIEELCSMDCKTAKAIGELCDYLEEEVIAKLQKMATTAAEAAEAVTKEGDRALLVLQNIDMYTARQFETCHTTGAENLLEPGAGAPTRSMLQYPSQYMHGQASAYNSNNTINTTGTTASCSKSSSDSAGSRRSAE
eukprot:8387-Heterococcus_DN1.PRE.3